jgi:glycosyltransferase involved in cell wall biosynthesis
MISRDSQRATPCSTEPLRLLIDALPARRGGIATHAKALISTWELEFPQDEIFTLVDSNVAYPDSPHPGRRIPVQFTRPRSAFQSLQQTNSIVRCVKAFRPQALLAVAPQVSLVRPGVPELVFVHDMRHHLLPNQFTLLTRVQRFFAYRLAYHRAAAFLVPSQRTRVDLASIIPSALSKDISVVPHGVDHVPERPPRDPGHGIALAFGHHPNKRPDLLVRAWALLASRPPPYLPNLCVTGCDKNTSQRLTNLSQELGVGHMVETLPFLPDSQFEELRAQALLIVFPTDHEGFGLPVLEAMRQSIPVVVTPDRAVQEITGGHAIVSDSWTPEDLSVSIEAALLTPPDVLLAARLHARHFTWKQSVEKVRQAFCRLLGNQV